MHITTPQSLFRTLAASVTVLAAAVSLSGCSIFKTPTSSYRFDLEIWGVFDDSQDYATIFAQYQEDVHPYAGSITFRKFPVESYEKELLDALAAGKGPDIFMVNNAWVPDYVNKIAPAPEQFVNKKQILEQFPDVVAEDFLFGDKVYGVPLSVDSLALYYNKDYFNAAGITAPPATWDEFAKVVQRLTQVDQFGNIVRAGAAMGTSNNVNRSMDVLTLLFLQGGVTMADDTGSSARFSRYIDSGGQSVNAGERALQFYTDFAAPSRATYTWNRRQHYSLDAFTEGSVGMMVNYSYHYNTIRRKNEKLNFAVARVPQLTMSDPAAAVNFANYWGFAVAANKQAVPSSDGTAPLPNEVRIAEAWQFLSYLTLDNAGVFHVTHGFSGAVLDKAIGTDPAAEYATRTGKPAARKDLLATQKDDPVLAPFAAGNLIAHNWRRPNATAVDGVLAQMIESVNLGEQTPSQALQTAEARASRLLLKE